ncbi:flagellar protein [Rhizobium lentis]|uniref:flagellar protein n=1 Tax=Rhizobium lentis TaxID=1138194 RepID=UPI001C829493|nr:flagellar protein [Rhizobium lentis]MBX5046818.1 flagellar protein [Rhizobium lentis]MBX5058830.1 flagellar protein [Rhizobium lentis]
MAEFDDERIASLKPRGKTATQDRFLTFAGLALAGASALFPWYVFFNADKFGINVATSSNSRELPDWPARNVFSVSPLAMVNKNEAAKKVPPVDALTTATVSNLGRERDGAAMLEDQPFPGKSSFRLLHVSNGRALIEDPSGMYVVRIGSVLPDESRLATLEQRDGKWVIITSKGEIYKND